MTTQPVVWIVLALLICAGCHSPNSASDQSQSLTAADAAAVANELTSFMAGVARDVSQQGPLAWNSYFDESPSFFMAVNGQIAFANGAAAKDGIQHVALTLKHIDLKWGDDLRVDPLSRNLGIVASSWRETQVDAAAHSVDENGFFTGLAEYRDGHWRFRNAHWSSPLSNAR